MQHALSAVRSCHVIKYIVEEVYMVHVKTFIEKGVIQKATTYPEQDI